MWGFYFTFLNFDKTIIAKTNNHKNLLFKSPILINSTSFHMNIHLSITQNEHR
jgi:hypothetical protein